MKVVLEIVGDVDPEEIEGITEEMAKAINRVLRRFELRCVDVSPDTDILKEMYRIRHDKGQKRIEEYLEKKLKKLKDEEKKRNLKLMAEICSKAYEFERDEMIKFLDTINLDELAKVPKVIVAKVLYDAMVQACADSSNYGDSMALTYYANALRLLARFGLFEIHDEWGRRVLGKFKV